MRRFIHAALLTILATVCQGADPPNPGVDIRADFPGGNVLIREIKGDVVQVEPDLRGGRDWFYWCFAVRTNGPRRLSFIFPEEQMKFVGMQGPAVSRDDGETWGWLGAEGATGSTFSYEFQSDEEVRFAVTIPYLQSDLDRFLEDHVDNLHLTVSQLTRTRHDRPVELLRIGEPDDGRVPVLMTARHHACESMASFLLEGFLRAALSDSEQGRAFREKYVLYAIPIVDKDGVQEGDQGKNRNPHDHNRDYGDDPAYPEVAAIVELGRRVPFRIAVDFHCPTLWMDYHQVIYFPGPRDVPATNLDNVTRLADVIKQEFPPEAPRGCLVMLKNDREQGLFADHFARSEGAIMSMTLEFPYAPPGKNMDPASCVRYGEALLRAWNRTQFSGG